MPIFSFVVHCNCNIYACQTQAMEPLPKILGNHARFGDKTKNNCVWFSFLGELSAETAHVNRNGVFVNSDIMMKHIDVYGFDYDYTLVSYNNEVPKLIYDHAKKLLVEKFLVSLLIGHHISKHSAVSYSTVVPDCEDFVLSHKEAMPSQQV